jgi:N-sulfoglucosamine sulfohydrolase
MKAQINRRDFLKGVGLSVSAVAVPGYTSTEEKSVKEAPRDRPNLLWITCEDISPALGCYGDPYAVTPNLDRLAAEGVLYENAFATAPVCSPARSCLITGMYATSLGTQHLRSNIRLPHHVKCFSEYLREADITAPTTINKITTSKPQRPGTTRARWRTGDIASPASRSSAFSTPHNASVAD